MASSRFSIGESIIWFSDGGNPEQGVVKWIGKLPGYGDHCMLGIEFIDPVGNDLASFVLPDGFLAKQYYNSLVHEDEVLTMEEFDTTILGSPCFTQNDASSGWSNDLGCMLEDRVPSRLSIGESIIWISDDGSPEHGVVKWIGRLPGNGYHCMLGIEFINPVGNDLSSFVLPDGFYPKQYYGSFLSEDEVMTMEEYDRIYLSPLSYTQDGATSMLFSDEDSVNMFPTQHHRQSSRKVCQNKGGTCIITVGSTGTGKSSTIKLYTLQNVMVSDGAKSETGKCSLFINKRNPDLPVWLDTVGLNDSRGKDDQLSFQELLHFINENNITKVQAVIWTITPNIRKDANLQKQGDFIDQICPGKIWNNVVIIAKAGMNPEQDCQGALEVAAEKQGNASIQCLSYRYYEDPSFNDDLRNKLRHNSELRSSLKVVTEDEVYHLLKEKLDSVTEPVQVIFKNKKCVDCGAVGDERLLPKSCHMKKVMVHNDEFECYHPGKEEEYHLLNKVKIHPGETETSGGYSNGWVTADNVVKLIPVVNLVGGIVTEIGKQMTYTEIKHLYTCCHHNKGAPGCKTIWECCKQMEDNPGCKKRYDCCFNIICSKGCQKRYKCCMKDEGTIGCVAECKNCQALWGLGGSGCTVKSHNLITL